MSNFVKSNRSIFIQFSGKQLLAMFIFCLSLPSGAVYAQAFKTKLKQSKLSQHLFTFQEQLPSISKSPQTLSAFLAQNAAKYMVQGDKVAIEAIAKENSSELETQLRALGSTGVVAVGKFVNAWVPFTHISALEGLPALQRAYLVFPPLSRVGDITTQGDEALLTDDLRTTFMVAGTGVKIGTISDSYNHLGGEAAAILTNDLPGAGNTNGYTTGVQIVQELGGSSGTDEGRAMIELMHDVAPAATHAFHTGFGGQAVFAQGILDLEAVGCDIIVDDVGYLVEPFFQDGIIAQAIDQVVGNGVLYFSAAGNSGTSSFESAFVDGGNQVIQGSNYTVHNFGGGDYEQGMSLVDGATVTLSLQWDDPWNSISGSPGPDTDIDLFILDNGSNVVDRSINDNIGNDPFEFIQYTNSTGSTQNLHIVIGKYLDAGASPNPGILKYIFSFSDNASSINEYLTNSSTCYGHSNSEGAITTGAIFYFATPEFSGSPPFANNYSSRGGLSILFDLMGNSISEDRQKPDFLSPDGGNTTFFGQSIADGDAFPNFFGTSAAAPHAAGMAALLLEGFPTANPGQVRNAFINTAIDVGSSGYDIASGFGIIQGPSAYTYLSGILGVEWAYVRATEEKGGISLEWGSLGEIGLDGYLIEHSLDNEMFREVGFTKAHGENIPYQHQLTGLGKGLHYLRLKALDFDGTTHLSKVIEVEVRQGKSPLNVMYVKEKKELHIASPIHFSTGEITVFDMNGKTVAQSFAPFEPIPLSGLSHGLYFYRLEGTSTNGPHFHSGKILIGF